MEHIASLFPAYDKPRKATSERAELLRYFVERARDREGKPYKASYIAYKLSHMSVFDLAAFKSDLEDRERRFPGRKARGELMPVEEKDEGFNWNRAFFAALKPR